MTEILVIKYIMLSVLWTLYWLMRFVDKEPTPKRLTIMCAPWIVVFVYIMLFWW